MSLISDFLYILITKNDSTSKIGELFDFTTQNNQSKKKKKKKKKKKHHKIQHLFQPRSIEKRRILQYIFIFSLYFLCKLQ